MSKDIEYNINYKFLWENFRNKNLKSLEILESRGTTKAIFGFCYRVLSDLSKIYGFTFIDVITTKTGKPEPGVICFDPEGKEFYKRIPYKGFGIIDVVKISLNHDF